MFKRISSDETSSLPESQRMPRDSVKVLRLHNSWANWLRSPQIGDFSKENDAPKIQRQFKLWEMFKVPQVKKFNIPKKNHGTLQWKGLNLYSAGIWVLKSKLLGQWLNFKLFGITYLVGKIKFKLLCQGPLAK